MSSHNHHYRDPEFNAEQTADYTLLIQAYAPAFSYAIISQDRLLVLQENVGIDELAHHELLSATYKESIIGLPQNGFSFVPLSLFRSNLVVDFARFLDIKSAEKVFSQSLDANNQVIYKVDGSLADTIAEKFDLNHTVFSAKGWIKVIAATDPSYSTLYLNIYSDKVEILNFKDGKLRFYNSFGFKTEDELAYFATFVANELELQPQSITVILSGDVDEGDQNITRLAKFFAKVELTDLKPVELPQEISSHNVLTLTALSLCGSSEAH